VGRAIPPHRGLFVSSYDIKKSKSFTEWLLGKDR